MLIDAPEAVGNIDHAADGILNSFHGLHDAAQQHEEINFDFYANPFCAFVLQIRNARHHNHARGIRGIHRCARTEDEPVNYILVNFPSTDQDDGGSFAEYYVSWYDMREYLDRRHPRHAASVAASMSAIGVQIFEPWCEQEEYAFERIFINIIPIIITACVDLVSEISGHINTDSLEAESFLDLFETGTVAHFEEPTYLELTSAVFWPQ